MKKIIIILGLLMAVGASAHSKGGVTIKNIEKVIVKTGMSHHKAEAMIKCLLLVKKYENAEAAIDAKMAMVKEKCAKHAMSDKKCQKMQGKMAKKIHSCFMKKEFVEEFLKTAVKAEPTVAVEPTPTAE